RPVAARAQQTPELRATFDVASVKVNTGRDASSMRVLPNGIVYVRQSLRSIIAQAYDVTWSTISTLDASIDQRLTKDSYNVSARTDGEASSAQLMGMLRLLLAERFRLAVHRETRVQPVYRLGIAAGGHRLTIAPADGVSAFVPVASGGVECHNMT